MDDVARAGGDYSATRYKVPSGNSEQNIGTIINHKPQKLSSSISGHVVTIRGLSIASSVSNGITTSSLSAGFNRIHRVRKPSLSWLRALSEKDDSSVRGKDLSKRAANRSGQYREKNPGSDEDIVQRSGSMEASLKKGL